MEKKYNREIGRRIMDPQRLQYLMGYKDAYGDDMLDKLMSKLRAAQDIAWRFGFDERLTEWLLTLRDLAWKHWDEADDPQMSVAQAAAETAKELLSGLSGEDVDSVTDAAVRVAAGKDASAEEKIACVVQEVFDHMDRLADPELRSALRISILSHQYQDKVCATGRLVEYEPLDLQALGYALREKKRERQEK